MLHHKISKFFSAALIGGFVILASYSAMAQTNPKSESFLLEDGDRIEDVDPGYLESLARERAERTAEIKARQEAEAQKRNLKVAEGPVEGPKQWSTKPKQDDFSGQNSDNPNTH